MQTEEQKSLEKRLDAAFILLQEICLKPADLALPGSPLTSRLALWLERESLARHKSASLGVEGPEHGEPGTASDSRSIRTFRLQPKCELSVNDIADRLGACLGWLNCTLKPPITVSRSDIIEALEAVIDGLG